jgi:hypothetical protein
VADGQRLSTAAWCCCWDAVMVHVQTPEAADASTARIHMWRS